MNCVNSRKMEQNVVHTPAILQILRQHFVVATLYVDDRADVPEVYKDWKDENGNSFRMYGDVWQNLESLKFKMNSQPLYVVVDENENNLAGKATYSSHGNKEDFKQWLLTGLKKYRDKQ